MLRRAVIFCWVSLGLSAVGCSQGAEPTQSEPRLECAPVSPAPAGARLLTRVEYDNSVADLLGLELGLAEKLFPAENTVLGFSNNLEAHQASPLSVEKYLEAAETITQALDAEKLAELLPCAAPEVDATCANTLIETLGKRAFRRPLQPAEAAILRDLFTTSSAKYGGAEAARLVIQGLLQAPQFLYRPESMGAPTVESGAVQLNSYEIASRLSYFLWNSMPDAELFAAADLDQLRTAEQIEAQARRLLKSPRARRVSLDFHRQWLGLGRMSGLVREGTQGVQTADKQEIDPSKLPAAWQASIEYFLTDLIFEQAGSVEDLFTSRSLYVDAQLAALYGVEAEYQSQAPSAGGFAKVELSDKERAGLLTQPGLLALLAHPDQSAPIQRGVFVREQMLCQPIESPPPSVDQRPPDPDPNLTTRERFAEHTAIPGCASCHDKIDGVGFGLENYDQLGRFRAEEYGMPIDASGRVVEAREERLNGKFNGAVALSKKLADSAQVEDCMARQWYRYATGRVETEDDACSLQQIRAQFAASGGNIQELLVAVTLSDAFRFRVPGAQDGVE